MKRGPGVPVVGRGFSTAAGAAQEGRDGPGSGQPTPSAAALQIEEVRDNLYLLRGGGRTVRVGDVNLPTAGTTAAFIPVAALTNIDTVITGHYQTTLTMADLKTYGNFAREFVQAVQAAQEGRPDD